MDHAPQEKAYSVRAVQCDYRSSDEEVYQALKRATAPLTRAWEKLRKARRIGIKFNQDYVPSRVKMHQGHRMQIVSDPVSRATMRLLKENTSAEIFAIDVGVEGPVPDGVSRLDCATILPIMKEFGGTYIDGNLDDVKWVSVPGGGQMFDMYPVPASTVAMDAMISVQKMKNHLFMGVTLTMKNLFGLVPILPKGRPRTYYHHLVRMPYMLADLGRIFNPALNIIDGLVCQAGEEWGAGDNPRVCNTLVAGDQTVATDAFTAHLMGHDPRADWLTPPFHRDRNALLCAAEAGFGTVNLDEIDYQSEVQAPVGEFFSKSIDPLETMISWHRTTAEQGMHYIDHKKKLVDQYAGQYILLQMNEVRWSDPSGYFHGSRRNLSGSHPEQAMWLKFVDPEEPEAEKYTIYENTLKKMKEMALL